MHLTTLHQAYLTPDQRGSIFTLPLRSYHTWFQGKIDAAEGPCQKVALQVAYAALGIFATLLLTIPTLIGIAFNLRALPLLPEANVQAYSIWAQIKGIPTDVENVCQQFRERLQLLPQKAGSEPNIIFLRESFDLDKILTICITGDFSLANEEACVNIIHQLCQTYSVRPTETSFVARPSAAGIPQMFQFEVKLEGSQHLELPQNDPLLHSDVAKTQNMRKLLP